MADPTPVRTRTRPSMPATVAPRIPSFQHQPGSELRDGRTGMLLGWTVRQPDGSYAVFRCEPVGIGTAKDYPSAHALLTKDRT